MDKVSFGNIFKDPISTIWNVEAYARFREHFLSRERRSRDLLLSLWNGGRNKNLSEEHFPDPPPSCMTCYKILGV